MIVLVLVLGVVAVLGRSPLADAELGGQTLVERAVGLLDGVCSKVVVVRDDDALTRKDLIARIGSADLVVVHDPLCPLVESTFVAELVEQAAAGPPVVAVHRVVDTVKSTRDGFVVGTVDREALRVVSSPVVARSADLLALGDLLAVLADPVLLAVGLREHCRARLVVAPPAARRVDDASALGLLISSAAARPPAPRPSPGPRGT